jgi:hypothetical protein
MLQITAKGFALASHNRFSIFLIARFDLDTLEGLDTQTTIREIELKNLNNRANRQHICANTACGGTANGG